MGLSNSIEYAKLRSNYYSEKTFPVTKSYTDDETFEIWFNLLTDDARNQLPKTIDAKLFLSLAKIVHVYNGKVIDLEFRHANGYTRKVNSMTCIFRFSTLEELILFEKNWEEDLKTLHAK